MKMAKKVKITEEHTLKMIKTIKCKICKACTKHMRMLLKQSMRTRVCMVEARLTKVLLVCILREFIHFSQNQ